MAILMVRHGETASNAARIVQHPETPLSERGLAQAELLAKRLAGLGVARIVTSDYARARMTADRVLDATGAPLEVWAELRERNLGDLRGRAYQDIGFDIFAEGYHPPNGESWEQFHERVARAWDRVQRAAARESGNLAVITHGLVCRRVVAEHAGGLDGGVPEHWGNTSLTILGSRPPHGIEVLNCCQHLGALERPAATASGQI